MFSAAYIFWDPNPIAFTVGPISVAWYGILFAISFLAGYLILDKAFKSEGTPELVRDKMLLYVVIGTVVGARLGHVLFYDPVNYLSDPISILNIREGGLASHGAAIGLILAMFIFSKRITKRSIFWGLDRLVIVVALSGLFIRSGNLMNSEIVGSPTTVSWGFIFPQEDQLRPFLSLEQAEEGMRIEMKLPENQDTLSGRFSLNRSIDGGEYTKVKNLLILSSDGGQISKNPQTGTLTFSKYQVVNQGGIWRRQFAGLDSMSSAELSRTPVLQAGNPVRLVDDIQKADYKTLKYQVVSDYGLTYGSSKYQARHPSQIYEALTYFVIFFFLLWLYWFKRKQKVPEGELFGWFLVLVFGARFVIEHFKEVQEAWEQALPINMGQILSIPFVLIGVVVLIWVYRRKKSILHPDHKWPESYLNQEKGKKPQKKN